MYTIKGRAVDDFAQGYMVCALWSSTDNSDPSGGNPIDDNYSIDDIAADTLDAMIADCARFQLENAALLSRAYASDVYVCGTRYNASCAGHDFWLTRNGHGAGFWDRGLDDVGEALTAACKGWREVYLWINEETNEVEADQA